MCECKHILSSAIVEPSTSAEAAFQEDIGGEAGSGVVDGDVTGAGTSNLAAGTTAG